MFDANNQPISDLSASEGSGLTPQENETIAGSIAAMPAQTPSRQAAPVSQPQAPLAHNPPTQTPPAQTPPQVMSPIQTANPKQTEDQAKPEGTTEQADMADLINLKQKALSELSPLVDKLNQSPEERFKTMLMLIQATDDWSLVNRAYKAAEAIEDEKNRAQALLDIINEINYFAQNKNTA